MLISCRFSSIGFHLLLLTHIGHSFVLITANVEDVKKIARKFVSDSLAEKIADFIARATETMAQNTKISEENENNADESSQVSAENRMYNVESHGFDSQAGEDKSKEEIVLEKVPKKILVEKKRHGFEDSVTTVTTRKPRKEPKPLHGISRYIVQAENKATLATERALSETSEEDKYNKMKESIQLLEDNLFSTPDGTTKTKKQKKKGRAYKLLSGFASAENDEVIDDIPDSKVPKDEERLFHVRTMDDKIALSLPGIEQHNNIENEKKTEEAAIVVAQHEIKDDNNTEMVPANEPSHLIEKDEFDHEENKIIQITDKVTSGGSRSMVTEADGKEEYWWEQELPAHAQEVNSKGKSWF